MTPPELAGFRIVRGDDSVTFASDGAGSGLGCMGIAFGCVALATLLSARGPHADVGPLLVGVGVLGLWIKMTFDPGAFIDVRRNLIVRPKEQGYRAAPIRELVVDGRVVFDSSQLKHVAVAKGQVYLATWGGGATRSDPGYGLYLVGERDIIFVTKSTKADALFGLAEAMRQELLPESEVLRVDDYPGPGWVLGSAVGLSYWLVLLGVYLAGAFLVDAAPGRAPAVAYGTGALLIVSALACRFVAARLCRAVTARSARKLFDNPTT